MAAVPLARPPRRHRMLGYCFVGSVALGTCLIVSKTGAGMLRRLEKGIAFYLQTASAQSTSIFSDGVRIILAPLGLVAATPPLSISSEHSRSSLPASTSIAVFTGLLCVIAKTLLQLDTTTTYAGSRAASFAHSPNRAPSISAATENDEPHVPPLRIPSVQNDLTPPRVEGDEAMSDDEYDRAMSARNELVSGSCGEIENRDQECVPTVSAVSKADAASMTTPRFMTPRQEDAQPLTPVTPDIPTLTPRTALRPVDAVTLILANDCSSFDISAFLTAAAKYGARQVVVPFGCAKDAASFGSPRDRVSTKSIDPMTARVTTVAFQCYEYIRRFERYVAFTEIAEGSSVEAFVNVNRSHLHHPEAASCSPGSTPLAKQYPDGEKQLIAGSSLNLIPIPTEVGPVETVAVYRSPRAGAVPLFSFEHPASAAYIFVKEDGNNSASPAAARELFASPLQSFAHGGPVTPHSQTEKAHAALTREHVENGSSLGPLAWCNHHVFVSSDKSYNTFSALVNIALYDRTAKAKRKELESK